MSVTRPLGFRASAIAAGLKKSGKSDLTLIVCDGADPGVVPGGGHPIYRRTSAAAVFTTNAVVGAPIEIGRAWRARQSRDGTGLRAVLINSGTSNAATGDLGVRDAQRCMEAVAAQLGCTPGDVLPSSTGVIGRRLPVEKIEAAIPTLIKSLARGEDADAAAARGIMTTDMVPKTAHREVEFGGHTIHLGAIAKGSGMIAPRLDCAALGPGHGTMLAFITTDAPIEHAALQSALEWACCESFNRISVDAHPSCSDTVVAIASGACPVNTVLEGTPEYHVFRGALAALCAELAEKIVVDGEGATRIFRVEVRGANTSADAEKMARAVVDSPLVKCAIHGKDPNWGRIVTAAGNAGVRFNPREASLTIGGVEVYRDGLPAELSAEMERKLREAMGGKRVEMRLTVGHERGSAWMMGCDLSAEYVRINAEYTT